MSSSAPTPRKGLSKGAKKYKKAKKYVPYPKLRHQTASWFLGDCTGKVCAVCVVVAYSDAPYRAIRRAIPFCCMYGTGGVRTNGTWYSAMIDRFPSRAVPFRAAFSVNGRTF